MAVALLTSPDTPEALSAWTGSDGGSQVASPAATLFIHNSPIMDVSSPALSTISSFVPKDSMFTGQSPTIAHPRMAATQLAAGDGRTNSPYATAAPRYLGMVEEEDRAWKELSAREDILGKSTSV